MLREGQYVRSEHSLHFPDVPITGILPDYLEQSQTTGRTALMRSFRQWIQEYMR